MRNSETPELHALRGYLAALSDFIFAANYEIMFEVRGFELGDSAFSAREAVRLAYPTAKADAAEVSERSPAEMIENLNECLKLPDRNFSEEWLATLAQKQINGGFLKHLRACIEFDGEDSTIFEYDDGESLGFYDVFWRFAYVIHDGRQRRCLIIHGASSD